MRRFVMAALLCLVPGLILEARDKTITAGWAELAPHVTGQKFSTVLRDGTSVQGRALSVEPEGLRASIRKSSSADYPKSKSTLLPRESLSSIRIERSGTKWKILAPVIGFFGLGAAGGFAGAAVDRGCFILCDSSAIGILAGITTGVAGGVVLGQHLDRHHVVVTITR